MGAAWLALAALSADCRRGPWRPRFSSGLRGLLSEEDEDDTLSEDVDRKPLSSTGARGMGSPSLRPCLGRRTGSEGRTLTPAWMLRLMATAPRGAPGGFSEMGDCGKGWFW